MGIRRPRDAHKVLNGHIATQSHPHIARFTFQHSLFFSHSKCNLLFEQDDDRIRSRVFLPQPPAYPATTATNHPPLPPAATHHLAVRSQIATYWVAPKTAALAT